MNKGYTRRTIRLLSALMALAVFVLAGVPVFAGGSRNNNQPAAAQTVSYTRIISAAPSNTEILVALGLGDRLIATDMYSGDVPGIPAGLPQIDFFNPDVEAVLGFNPDLIIVNEINSFGVADNPFRMLENLGIKMIDVPSSISIEGVYGDIMLIAETLGVKDRGESVVASMRQQVDQVAAAGRAVPQKKRVYFEVYAGPPIYTLGQGTFINDMIEVAGGVNIFADQNGWLSVAAEEIVMRDPEVIFVTIAYPGHDPVGDIKSNPAFQSISAVRNNQIYVIDANSSQRASPNLIVALREMSQALTQ